MEKAANDNSVLEFQIHLLRLSTVSGWFFSIQVNMRANAEEISNRLNDFGLKQLFGNPHRMYWHPEIAKTASFSTFMFFLSSRHAEQEFGGTLTSVLKTFCKLNKGKLICESKEEKDVSTPCPPVR